MSTIRVALSTAVVSALAVPLTLAAPLTAHATVVGPTLVYAADIDRDGYAGLYRAPASDPTNRTAILADNGVLSVDKALLSPDGSRIAVLYDATATNTGDTGARKLVTMNLDGSNQKVLVSETNTFGATSASLNDVNGFGWKGNTTVIYGWSTAKFSSSAPVFTDQVRSVPATGGASSMISGTNGLSDPAVSSDGTQIAAINFGPHTGVEAVDILASSSGTIAAQVANSSTGGLRSPAWSPDGTAVSFVRDDSTDTLDASEIDVVRYNSGTSSWGAASAAVPVVQGANSSWLDEDPFWTDANTLMFERIDDSSTAIGSSGVAPIDLWTAAYNTGTSAWGAAAKVADTPTVDEWSPSEAPADVTAPANVTVLPFGLGGTSVTVNWSPNDADYSHVVVTRTDSAVGTPVPLGNKFGTSFVDTGLTVGHTYSYAFQTVDGAGNMSATDPNDHPVTATNLPKIVAVTPTALANTAVPFRFTWGVAEPAGTTYDVVYAVKGGATWALGAPTAFVTGTTATNGVFSKGVPGQTYYFQATAHDQHGNSGSAPWAGVNVALDQTAGTFSKGWATVKSSHYWLGSTATTSTN
ncbi:MAG: hypothetical protein JO079_06845, partial [Frankiaceae bacterium]|nr:hypothetical protein [Frankiaceae bacterium]